VVFGFLKKKLQESRAAKTPAGSEADYEERRKLAESRHEEGKTAEAIQILEALAGDLAGAGNFPLAVAVRHRIAQWKPDDVAQEAPAETGRKMAEQRAITSGVIQAPPGLSRVSESSIQRLVQVSTFLEELRADEIAGLIESTGLASYRAGQTVVVEGTAGDQLYIVTRGGFSVTTKGATGKPVKVGSLGVGDFFGEVAVLTGKPRAATVTADHDAECLQISAARWSGLSARYPRLKELLEQAIAVRAQLSAEAVVDDLRKSRSEG